jgi:DNA repair protein RadC
MELEESVLGHRSRAKSRLAKAKTGSLEDYELLEIALFYSIPRKDVKILAKTLLKEFGSLGNIINATPHKLQRFKGIGESSITLFRLFQEVIKRTTKEELSERPIIASFDKLINYIRSNIGYKTTESLHTIYLNSKHILIADEVQDYGTVNSVGVYPREIAKAALYHDASSIVLVHNHPSGITKPSQADITLTDKVLEALTPLNITLLDHIIISRSSYFSFKANKLL